MLNAKNMRRYDDKQEHTPTAETQDHFVEKHLKFAGTHITLDFWGASQLDDMELMETAMRKSVIAAHATLLHIHLHRFTPSGGLSGVAVLAESHISVHTWPERDFAAFDIFMCGDADPMKAARVLKEAFKPNSVTINEMFRGRVEETL
mgnify:CR=1 FL=1